MTTRSQRPLLKAKAEAAIKDGGGSKLTKKDAAINRLVLAGSKLSNIAYNLKQQKTPITEHQRRTMESCVRQWDAALTQVSALTEKYK